MYTAFLYKKLGTHNTFYTKIINTITASYSALYDNAKTTLQDAKVSIGTMHSKTLSSQF